MLANPFKELDSYDSEGNRVFGSEDSGSEDTAASDGNYGNDATEGSPVKSEGIAEETMVA